MFTLWIIVMMTCLTPTLWGQETETLVQIDTDMGKIKVKLYNDTPLHRDNLMKLVNESFDDGLLVHG
ncbi:MAG: peptidylprolyl isomerase, partial [Parabacteroides sp.]